MSIKVSQMPLVTQINGADYFPMIQGGQNVRVAASTLMNGFLNVKTGYGCKGDGVTNDATNFQLAINDAQVLGFPLFIPVGQYLIGSALSVTGHLTMFGAGPSLSFLIANTTSQDIISINTGTGRITFSDFSIAGKTNAISGALIRMTGNTINLYSSFTNVKFQDGWDQLFTISAASWSCIYCSFFSPKNTGVTIADAVNPDGGDMQILGCIFIGGGVGVAVSQTSAGGLRFVGNKVINWANGYQCSLSTGVNTSDLFIQACSFESFTDTAITCALGAGVGFGAVHILGNEINSALSGIKLQTDSGPWLNVVSIVGNEIANTTSTAIFVQGTKNFVIADNNILGSGVGISLGAVGSHGRIHDNLLSGFGANALAGAAGGMTSLIIHDNDGYNPVGSSIMTPGASPWTLTNGASPASISLSSSGQVTDITSNAISILGTVLSTNVPYSLQLGPNEAVIITYTGVLSAKRMIH